MSLAALSPLSPGPPSPMLMSMTPITPTLDSDISTSAAVTAGAPVSVDLDPQSHDGGSSPGPGPSQGSLPAGGLHVERDSSQRTKKPPPLHTGADWKVVLHLPEIEKWLRATSDRVTQLTHSVGQDGDNRHVDVHLVQLKDICEDISDHVEQIHALLETEFSLKLLSYSVNIIVDIRTVQLLWHQLRVSVLVLRERLLQGLQDSNGNFTRQTDILQAFSQDHHETRLDALTEVDDCGQLTIRCSQDYFFLDCGITAFELSDYSPSDDPEVRGAEPTIPDPQESNPQDSHQKLHNSLPDLCELADSQNHNHSLLPTMQCGTSNQSESAERPLQGVSLSTEVSPTESSAVFLNRGTRMEVSEGGSRKIQNQKSGLQFYGELSQSTPSLMDPPDRSKFWLELDSVYPENVSQSYDSLQVLNGPQLNSAQRSDPSSRTLLPDHQSWRGARTSSGGPPPPNSLKCQDEPSSRTERTRKRTHTPGNGDSDSSLPSPMREQVLSSDLEVSGEEPDPQPCPRKTRVWIVKQQGTQSAPQSSQVQEHWYGSEEFLALPVQLHQTEMLAMKLESLAESVPLRSVDSPQMALQDVVDWELTELSADWDTAESVKEAGNDSPSWTLMRPYRGNPTCCFSPTSSSDIAPSLDGSIESGPFSELLSEEDEGNRSAGGLELTAPPVDGRGCASLVQQLLEDVQARDKDADIWRKIECFVQKLDGFISWLQEALDGTENWTQPRQDLDSLRVYLDTHLSFKLNVDSHGALKEGIMEEGKVLLSIITSHQPALKDILHMVSSQWDQLQRQIRRQHGWMLRALRCIQARLFYTSQSHELFAAPLDSSANPKPLSTDEGLQAELISSQWEVQRAALEKMAVKLNSLKYPSFPRRHSSQLTRSNSLQEFEAEYQELWDWLMDMDAMVTDSHQLLMSEEQRHYLFKSSHAELVMMESRKTSLLGRAASLKRSGAELPSSFHVKMHNFTQTWRQLEKILSEHAGPSSSEQRRSSNENVPQVNSRGVAGENRRSALSPLTNSLLEQLEARIKELKTWLRDTELLIFNSCLRQEKDVSKQLPSFKLLCSEIRARRRGVASVLKLCQKLLQQSQSGPMAEAGPDAEQHREALQLLSINLERRWEAIVMQALQWQNRLKRELGEQQVHGNFLEVGLVDLCQISPVRPVAPPPDDSWEWDETDLSVMEAEPQGVLEPDLTLNLPIKSDRAGSRLVGVRTDVPAAQGMEGSRRSGESSLEVQHNMNPQTAPPNSNIVQVYSLHTVEFYNQPPFPVSSIKHKTKSFKKKLLLKGLSKDSSLSSVESLPDLLGGLMSSWQQGDKITGFQDGEAEGGRRSWQSENSRRSDCESGIVSDTGDTETTTTNSEVQGDEEDLEEKEGKREAEVGHHLGLQRDGVTTSNQRNKGEFYREEGRRRGETKKSREEEKRRRYGRGGGEAVEILINGHGILTPADSDSDIDVGGFDIDSSGSFMSHSDIKEFNAEQFNSLETFSVQDRVSSPVFSPCSSLESLLALGVELFPSKDTLQRSASLESCLNPGSSADGEAGGSLASLGELDLGQRKGREGCEAGNERGTESAKGEASSGELSRRTLDLLKRLENIQNPLGVKMTRSVSDMTLRSSSQRQSPLPVSPSLGGQHNPLSGGFGGSRKELSSGTELTSAEESSLGSEDFASHQNRRHPLLDPSLTANGNSRSCRKHCHNSSRGVEEADVVNLSMVVNVSCTSACTDEDEDDSDLLSSSTLTLTEEELGIRDEEDGVEERLSGASSGNEEDEDDNEEMESSYALGLEYMKRELQSWIRPPRSSSLSKSDVGLWDELQCGSSPSCTFTPAASKSIETNSKDSSKTTNRGDGRKEEESRRNVSRSYISQFVDDVENGNVEQSCSKGKDEDDELLREESSVFTKKGDPLRELYVSTKTEASYRDVDDLRVKTESDSTGRLCFSPCCELLPFPSKPSSSSSLVGQLRGELPCHSASLHSPSLSPVDDCRSQCASHSSRPAAGGRKAITIQEKFKFSSFVTEETRKELRAKDSSLPPKKWPKSHSSCGHPPSPPSLRPAGEDQSQKENVHEFVMEIIDMASVALKNKENHDGAKQSGTSGSDQNQSPASLAQIRDKVLEHSHRPLHLRKGDFYSYLSLSSHDSDCGEVNQCAEDKSSTPVPYSIPSYSTPTQGLHSPSPELFTSSKPHTSHSGSGHTSPVSTSNICSLDLKSSDSEAEDPPSPSLSAACSPDIRDEETLFAACTEEVYLGPPLCYSMVLTKKPRRFLFTPSFEASLAGGSELSQTVPLSSQEESDLKQEESSSGQPSSKESVLDQLHDHLYFQGPSEREKTQSCFPSVRRPCYSSLSSSTFYPNDGPSSPSSLSSIAKEETLRQEPYLSCDVAAGEVVAAASVSTPQEERSHNEGPPYLNPWVHVALIDSFAAECLEDIKTLESNMGTVMTKISVCSSATNPSKEPATAATRINPKINCSAMRKADREEGERREEVDTQQAPQEEKGRKGWSSSQQEAKTTMEKQTPLVWSEDLHRPAGPK